MIELKVPTLGESVTEATVATWFKKPGEAVEIDEMLCELETDKVTIEVPSSVRGIVSEIVAKEGETVVVSTAAGAVGSIVGQLAKMKGCKVIGLTGSDEKCKWLREELCFDGAINYKTGDVLEELKSACPEGIDIYFDNTGGIILDAVLKLIKLNARISVCGLISTYNSKEPAPGPYNYGNILMKRAKVEGFIVSDFAEEFPNALNDLSNWILEGKIKYNVDIQKGLENALVALDRLFTGDNTGKLILEVSKEEG